VTENLVLNGRYRLVRLIAVGGMGEVWQANDELLARPVAVKLLRLEHVSDEKARGRFRAEARFAGSLQHGGIAQVYDFGEHDDQVFLVMELVSGETLSEVLERRGQLSAEITLGVIGQAARALQVAHTAGIVHRDIKPGNLMVTEDDLIKITDFGIARDGALGSYTQTGMVMGTAHYVSPEQATGREVTGSSDLYSLGVLAYQCITGELPFDGNTAVDVALKHVHEPHPPLPASVPAPVRELIDRLLAKDPARRPASAQEVADEASSIRASLVFGHTSPTPVTLPPAFGSGEEPRHGYSRTAGEPSAAAAAAATSRVPRTTDGWERGPWEPPGTADDSWGDGEAGSPAGAGAAGSGRRPERRKGSVILLSLVGASILVLGIIMLGSMWPGSSGARYVDDYPGSGPTVEASPDVPGPAGGDEPLATPTPTPRTSKPWPYQRFTPTPTPRPRPTKSTTRPPRPTPTKTKSPSPTPTVSPSATGG
jgi:serine/threonine protein kinase